MNRDSVPLSSSLAKVIGLGSELSFHENWMYLFQFSCYHSLQ